MIDPTDDEMDEIARQLASMAYALAPRPIDATLALMGATLIAAEAGGANDDTALAMFGDFVETNRNPKGPAT